LTVVRAYIAAGKPGRLPWIGQTFGQWSDLVRSALVWLGRADPVLSQEAGRSADPRRQARVALFQAIGNAYGYGIDAARTANEMIEDARKGTITRKEPKAPKDPKDPNGILNREWSAAAAELKAALAQVAGVGAQVDPRWLGRTLSKDEGKIVDNLRLQAAYDGHSKVNRWYVERVD
jgi:putative DNA primase/helicase